MTEATVSPAEPRGGVERGLEKALRAHPIWLREARQSARLVRTPWLLFSLTLVVTLGLSAFGAVAVGDHVSPSNIGSMVFQAFFSIAYVVVVVAGSAIAANAIAAEREGRTLEALHLTGLSPKQIARQKFASSYMQLAQYIAALAPVGALAFVFGGVTATEVVVAFGLLFVMGALAVGLGLALSSLMPNMRAALLSTVAFSVIAGPLLWFMFGFGGSAAAHHMWSDVPDSHPIWLPLAYARAPFGAKYIILLIASPALLFGVPGWLLYEVTVANLSGDADDRSSGYKRWFLVSATAAGALVVAIASLGASARESVEAGTAGLGALFLLLGFASFLFAGDPLKASRKVLEEWRTRSTSLPKVWLGPGLYRTAALVTGWGLLVIALTTMGVAMFGLGDSTSTSVSTATHRLAAFAAYGASFFVFVVAFPSALRARGSRPVVARALCAGVLLLVSTVPWVAAAILAVAGGEKDLSLVVASPSPFYAIAMMGEINSYTWTNSSASITVGAGIVAVIGWAALGLSLLAYTVRRRPV